MNLARLHELAAEYRRLRIAIVGDFCLDRYLEIDPAREETSIETGLPVHNVTRVRAQPGAAGTVLGNLVAVGVGTILPVGFCGEDGEGFELLHALRSLPGVSLAHFIETPLRRTFTYCKPLVMASGAPPRELNRLDSKNWTPTPDVLREQIATAVRTLRDEVDAVIVMDQVDEAGTGVVTAPVLAELGRFSGGGEGVPVVADCRRSLRGYPPCIFKMNATEFAALTGLRAGFDLREALAVAPSLARENGRAVIVTLAERGIVGCEPAGVAEHVPALPLRGPIDVAGAGDSVTANVAAALAANATLREALQLAALASSVVIHQVGTTGAADFRQIAELL
jgi:rfaE bifunctional protein kinase chain/domain